MKGEMSRGKKKYIIEDFEESLSSIPYEGLVENEKYIKEEGENSESFNRLIKILNKLESDLNCKGISIFIYQDEINILKLYAQTKKSKVINNKCELILCKEMIIGSIRNKERSGLKCIENYMMEEDLISANCCVIPYAIIYENEFLGILNIYGERKYYIPQYLEDYLLDSIGLSLININIEAKLKEEQQKRSEIESDLDLFLQNTTELCGIMMRCNGCLKLYKSNKKLNNILGWSDNELSEISLEELIHPHDLEEVHRTQELMIKTGIDRKLTVRYKCKNGEYKTIEWNCKYIKKRKMIILNGKDKTEQIKIIENYKHLEEIINLENFKTEFFTNMSHDLKTPLNIILTTVQVILANLEKETLNEKNKKVIKHLNGIKQNSYRLLRLVNNIIDITKIDRGYYSLKLGNHNIVSVIEDIVLSVADYMNNKKRRIIFDTTEEEISVACDPDKIERIMLNLLSNALKYTNDNGMIEINLETDKDMKKVIVHVKNDGVPIPKEDCEKIFYRFKQSEKLLERKCEGSGIGLALVKSLIELHGGSIWVNTAITEGAEFIFEIPIRTIENEENKNLELKIKSSKIEKCSIEFSDVYSV